MAAKKPLTAGSTGVEQSADADALVCVGGMAVGRVRVGLAPRVVGAAARLDPHAGGGATGRAERDREDGEQEAKRRHDPCGRMRRATLLAA